MSTIETGRPAAKAAECAKHGPTPLNACETEAVAAARKSGEEIPQRGKRRR